MDDKDLGLLTGQEILDWMKSCGIMQPYFPFFDKLLCDEFFDDLIGGNHFYKSDPLDLFNAFIRAGASDTMELKKACHHIHAWFQTFCKIPFFSFSFFKPKYKKSLRKLQKNST